MTPEEAGFLAARIYTAIDTTDVLPYPQDCARADRERVASDLAGLRRHAPYGPAPLCCCCNDYWPCPDATERVAGLRRTAALYGVTE